MVIKQDSFAGIRKLINNAKFFGDIDPLRNTDFFEVSEVFFTPF